MRILLSIMFAGGMALATSVANAQTAGADRSPHGMVAIGAGFLPDYDGADQISVLPFVLADIRWRDIDFQLRGQSARMDLTPNSRFAVGPVLGVRLSREDVDGPVDLLPELDLAIEAGAFIGYRFGGDQSGQGSLQTELSLVQDVSSVHDGLLATASASYALIRQRDIFLTFDAQATWANQDYARAYFGVEEVDAATSGLNVFRPGAGFRDVALGLSAGYWFSPSFGVVGRAGANYLVGDIADSPVTKEGSRWQPFGGLALSYRY